MRVRKIAGGMREKAMPFQNLSLSLCGNWSVDWSAVESTGILTRFLIRAAATWDFSICLDCLYVN